MERHNAREERGRPLPGGPHQAAAIPFQVRDGSVALCLITTTRDRRWSIPKGVIDPGETALETVFKEANEEAGLRGDIWGGPVGRYEYVKWGRTLAVEVYLLHVTETAASWPEMGSRERCWVTVADARELLADHPVRGLLDEALTRLARLAGPVSS